MRLTQARWAGLCAALRRARTPVNQLPAPAPWRRPGCQGSIWAGASQAQRGAVIHRGAHNQGPGDISMLRPKLAYFSTGKPTGMASTNGVARWLVKTACRLAMPRRRPAARRASSAGMITSSSSRPQMAAFARCGFSPATRICGWAMPNYRAGQRGQCATLRQQGRRQAGRHLRQRLMGGQRHASCRRPVSIITTRGVWVRSARYSGVPENATPASFDHPLCAGR